MSLSVCATLPSRNVLSVPAIREISRALSSSASKSPASGLLSDPDQEN